VPLARAMAAHNVTRDPWTPHAAHSSGSSCRFMMFLISCGTTLSLIRCSCCTFLPLCVGGFSR